MPRETIPTDVGPYVVKVGWKGGGDVQVGVEVEGERSVFWTLLDNEDRASFGHLVRRVVSGQPQDSVDNGTIGAEVLGALDSVTGVRDSAPRGGIYGVWSTLDRKGCNDLIHILRRARDSAFGRDE